MVTRERGYELRLDPERLDSNCFERLIAEGRRELDAGNPERALAMLEEALSLWRGKPLADLAYEPFAQAEIARLEELRVAALELLVEAKLVLGRHAEVVGELETLIGDHPYRERLRGQLMVALYRCERQADALEAYQHARRALVEELGIEPGEQLRALEQAILAQDAALAAPAALPGVGAGGRDPGDLPTGVVTFVLTDIERSSHLWEADADAMAAALELHNELIERSVNANGGRLLKAKGEGDATLSVFRRASDAVACSVECQRALLAAAWPGGLDLRVRVALHTGEAHEREDDYFGPALNRAARLRGLARGGTTVVSQATAEIVRDRLPHGAQLVDLGVHELRGLARPERVFALRSPASVPQEEPLVEPAGARLPPPRPLRFPADASFVGREAEVGSLRKLWAEVSDGGRAAAFLAGEAGIGKTRLASELALPVHGEGALVLYGRCDEGLAVPYQPFVEALRPYTSAVGPARLQAELGPFASQLGRVLPELEALGEPARGDPESERFALFEAVSTLLEAATRKRPALLVLDDLHWAAPPTLLMLRHLIRSDRPMQTLVLGTYRDTELDATHPLAALLADLQRDTSATSVRVGGLDERAIGALLEAAAGHTLDERGGDLIQLLRAQTAGNPFFISEVLAHLVESGAIYRADERWTTDLAPGPLEVPEGLRQVIRHRVARLPEPARRALAVGSVAGPSFTLALLETVLGEQAGLLDGLEQAATAGLLAESGPGEYAFAHALVRQTIYAEHSSARRVRLHRRLGEALETRAEAPAHVEALAHHFAEAAADGQAAKAAGYALAAARRASARLAFEDAAAHCERGLQALELAEPPDEARRGELLLALGVACWRSGDVGRAREACRIAAELAQKRREPDQLARAALAYAGPVRFETAPAVTGPLIDLLERALEALGDGESALRARVMARLANALAFAAPERRRPELALQALDLVRRVGDRSEVADVLTSSHHATWTPDNLDQQLAKARELARVAAEVGDAGRAALASSWILTGVLDQGAIHEARRELAALNRAASTLPQPYHEIPRRNRASPTRTSGGTPPRLRGARPRGARVRGPRSRTNTRKSVLRHRCSSCAASRAGSASSSGRSRAWSTDTPIPPSGAACLPRATPSSTAARMRNESWRRSPATTSRPSRAIGRGLRHGHPERGRRLPRRFTAAPSGSTSCSTRTPIACVVVDGPFCLGSASRPLGLLATTVGRFDAAARHFEDALELNTRIQSPLWVAHTQHDYAQHAATARPPGRPRDGAHAPRQGARHCRQARAGGTGRQSSATQAPSGSRPFRVRQPRMTLWVMLARRGPLTPPSRAANRRKLNAGRSTSRRRTRVLGLWKTSTKGARSRRARASNPSVCAYAVDPRSRATTSVARRSTFVG